MYLKIAAIRKILKANNVRVSKEFFEMLNRKVLEIIDGSIKNKEECKDKTLRGQHLI